MRAAGGAARHSQEVSTDAAWQTWEPGSLGFVLTAMALCCRAFWRSFAKFVDTNEDGLISKAELKNFLCEPIPTAAHVPYFGR